MHGNMSPRRALAAACLAFGLIAPAASAAPTWLPPQALSEAGHHTYETATAMSAGGEIVSVWITEGRLLASLRAPGGSISAPITIASAASDLLFSPGVAISADGAIAVAWQDLASEKYEVSIRPPGGSFSAPVPIASPTSHIGFFTSVAIDEAGDVLVGTLTEDDAHYLASYAWRPAGGSFTLIPLSEPLNNNALIPAVALDPAGDAVVAWAEKPSGSELVVDAVRRPAGGAFGAPQTLSDGAHTGWNPSVAMGAGGQAAVAWMHSDGSNERIQVSTSTSPGALLSAPQTISRAGANGEYPAVAVSASGQAVVAWSEAGTGEIAGGPVGGSFGPVTDLEPFTGEMQLAIDAAGDAIAVWADREGSVNQASAAVRSASGAVSAPVALSSSAESVERLGNEPTVTVGMDAAGDAVAGWNDQVSTVAKVSIFDATGPTLELEVPATATAGQSVIFTSSAKDLFSGVGSTTWSFGDGNGATGISPSHVYTAPGTYTVFATATDLVGNSTTESTQITVLPAATPADQHVACATGSSSVGGSCPPALLPLRCRVPSLTGLTSAAAKHRLSSAHCRTGRVSVAKRYRHAKRLLVSSQSVKVGTLLPFDASVSLTLKPPPPPRHKKHRR